MLIAITYSNAINKKLKINLIITSLVFRIRTDVTQNTWIYSCISNLYICITFLWHQVNQLYGYFCQNWISDWAVSLSILISLALFLSHYLLWLEKRSLYEEWKKELLWFDRMNFWRCLRCHAHTGIWGVLFVLTLAAGASAILYDSCVWGLLLIPLPTFSSLY